MLSLLLLLTASAQTIHRISRRFVGVYAIEGEAGVVLVDAHNPGNEAWIEKKLARKGIALSDVTLLVLTHGHSDHAGSAAALQAAGIPVALGAGDAEQVLAGEQLEPVPTDWRGRLLLPMLESTYPSFTPDVLVTDRLDLTPYGVRGEAAVVGGHSLGSMVVLVGDQALVGDLIRGRMLLHHRPTLHFFHTDQAVAHAALGAVIDDGAATVLPAHGAAMPARRVRRWLRRRG